MVEPGWAILIVCVLKSGRARDEEGEEQGRAARGV